jgi:5-methylcytosine-specific restriction protein A
MKPCLACGRPAAGSRCPEHARVERTRIERARAPRPSPAQRGYGSAWSRTSRAIRAAVGACARCGSTLDLTVDHVEPHSDAAGFRVLCRRCHSAVGARRDRAARG